MRQLTLFFSKFGLGFTVETWIVSHITVAVYIKIMGGVIQTKRFFFRGSNRLDVFLKLVQQGNKVLTGTGATDSSSF